MKRLFLAAVLITSPAIAETVDVFVVDESGDGVTQHESDTTVAESEVLISGSRPEGATGVVLEEGKRPRWTDLSPEEVNENFGGDGEPPIVNLDDDEMEFDEEEERPSPDPTPTPTPSDDDPSDLDFEGSADAAKISPLAGKWIGIILDQTFEGCPPGIAEAIRAQGAALDFSVVQDDISPSFDPAVSIPQFSWETRGPNSWIGDMDMTQGGAGMRVQWAMRVLNPSLINGRQQIDVVGPMMGGCKISLRFQYDRIG